MPSLFDSESLPGSREPLQEGAVLLRDFVLACPSRWDYPLFSCGVGNVVPIQCAAFNLKTVTLLCGEARRASSITAWLH
jgi:hypothetical protein